jgi:hypothetical protein
MVASKVMTSPSEEGTWAFSVISGVLVDILTTVIQPE